ncbi:unnamed protein product, partial [Aphanomyces euteiches]
MGSPTTERSEASRTQQSEASRSQQSDVAVALDLAQYFVDFQAKKSSLFGGKAAQYGWRQFVLTGKTLEIYDHGTREDSFRVRGMTIEHISGHVYRLKGNLWHKLELSCPSTSRLERFRQVLERAASSPEWSPPTHDVLANFLHVAKEINEAEATIPSKVATSSVTVAQVQDHFNEMLAIYDFQSQYSTMEQVYSHLLDLEDAYISNFGVANFAHTVHRLHPVRYQEHQHRSHEFKLKPRTSIKAMYGHCPHPHCGKPLSVDAMYKFHIKGETVECASCSNKISLETFSIADFIANAPRISVDRLLKGGYQPATIVTPAIPADGRAETFMTELRTRLKTAASEEGQEVPKRLRFAVISLVREHFNGNRSPFGFDLVKAMIRQLDFVNKI